MSEMRSALIVHEVITIVREWERGEVSDRFRYSLVTGSKVKLEMDEEKPRHEAGVRFGSGDGMWSRCEQHSHYHLTLGLHTS